MPVFLRGRRAFCIIPAPPTSPRPALIQSTVSPIRALPTLTSLTSLPHITPTLTSPPTQRLPPATPTLTSPPPLRLPPATPTLTSLTSLPPPVTPTLTSPLTLRLPATPTLSSPAPLPPPSDTEAPHGPQPLPLGLKCRTARACSPVLPEAPPRPASLLQICPEHRHGPRPFSGSARGPRPGARGTKKADGTAQRPVRRQKATNLSRQHHRGRSSGSPENRLF